jgi:hypothetical protein
MDIPDAPPSSRIIITPPAPRPGHALLVGIGISILFVLVIIVAFVVGFTTKREYELLSSENLSGDEAVDIDMTSVTLNVLTGDVKSTIDIHKCFENAMKSRRVQFRESLVVINPSEITLSSIIGEGSFGRVWAGRWRNDAVAVKEFVFAQTALMGGSMQTSELIEEIIGEAGIMSTLNHPKILQLYGCSLTPQTIWIVTELCMKGSLKSVLSSRTAIISMKTKLSLCLDIADGMNYLHTRRPPIIHRDLKV